MRASLFLFVVVVLAGSAFLLTGAVCLLAD